MTSNYQGLCTPLSNGTLLYLPACQQPTLIGSRSLPVWAELEASHQQQQSLLCPVCHLAGLTAGSSQTLSCWFGQTRVCQDGAVPSAGVGEAKQQPLLTRWCEELLGSEILLDSRELWEAQAVFPSVCEHWR